MLYCAILFWVLSQSCSIVLSCCYFCFCLSCCSVHVMLLHSICTAIIYNTGTFIHLTLVHRVISHDSSHLPLYSITCIYWYSPLNLRYEHTLLERPFCKFTAIIFKWRHLIFNCILEFLVESTHVHVLTKKLIQVLHAIIL